MWQFSNENDTLMGLSESNLNSIFEIFIVSFKWQWKLD